MSAAWESDGVRDSERRMLALRNPRKGIATAEYNSFGVNPQDGSCSIEILRMKKEKEAALRDIERRSLYGFS